MCMFARPAFLLQKVITRLYPCLIPSFIQYKQHIAASGNSHRNLYFTTDRLVQAETRTRARTSSPLVNCISFVMKYAVRLYSDWGLQDNAKKQQMREYCKRLTHLSIGKKSFGIYKIYLLSAILPVGITLPLRLSVAICKTISRMTRSPLPEALITDWYNILFSAQIAITYLTHHVCVCYDLIISPINCIRFIQLNWLKPRQNTINPYSMYHLATNATTKPVSTF